MAQRSNVTEITPANEVLSVLVEMTKETPKVTLRALELASATLIEDLLPLLDELENAGKIHSEGRGEGTLLWVKDATPTPPAKPKRTKPVASAVQPVKAADGENITVPVSEDSTERRELDASKGERLISEDIATGGTFVPVVLAGLVNVPKPYVEQTYESDIAKNGLELPEPEYIPPTPEGVNGNLWYMAHAAITQTARDWWKAYIIRTVQPNYDLFA